MAFFDSVSEAGERSVRHNMRWIVNTDRMLHRQNFLSKGFADIIRTEAAKDNMSKPNYADPHPTPGAMKVPEILKGGVFNTRI